MAKKNPKQDRAKEIYQKAQVSINLRNSSQRFFNDRTLIEFINDMEKRFNGYTPSREEQGKEDWQANFFHPTTRNKVKAIIAGASGSVPTANIRANKQGSAPDQKRAEVISHLVDYSRQIEDLQDSLQTDNFFSALELATKGTVIEECTYETVKRKHKTITSYNVETMDFDWEEEEKIVRAQCSDSIIPLEEMYFPTFTVEKGNIQKMPYIDRIKYYSLADFQDEFGAYKDAQKVVKADKNNVPKLKANTTLTPDGANNTFMNEENAWHSRCSNEGEDVEVIKHYDKFLDEYVVIANGIVILDVPMLISYKGEKVYGFAKTVFEPFASNFFYGNPLPNSMMGEQDIINSLYNMLMDKTYRTLDRQLIAGQANRDALDWENDPRDPVIYVSSVNEVKEMPLSSVNQSELSMVNLISQGLDLTSVDKNQQGVQGTGNTAREVIIAAERAKKLAGVFTMFQANLWKQKTILRIANILTFYTQPAIEMALSDADPKVKSKFFAVTDAQLSDGNTGTLNIEMVDDDAKMPTREDMDDKERESEKEGRSEEFMAIRNKYVDEWHFDVLVEQSSIGDQEESLAQAKQDRKLAQMAQFFPQIFGTNQKAIFTEFARDNGDDVSKYNLDAPPPLPPEAAQQGAPQQQPQ